MNILLLKNQIDPLPHKPDGLGRRSVHVDRNERSREHNDKIEIPAIEFIATDVAHTRLFMRPEAKHEVLCDSFLRRSFGLVSAWEGGEGGVGGAIAQRFGVSSHRFRGAYCGGFLPSVHVSCHHG